MEQFGTTTAVVGTARFCPASLTGPLALLPVFAGIGLALGWLRSRTGSMHPGVLVHGV